MNWRLILLSVLQSLLLAGGQVSLKLAMVRTPRFTFDWPCIRSFLTNWWFLFTGLFFGASTVLWMYILKHFPLSESYPLTSLAYVFGLIAAIMIFHESAGTQKWIGVVLILLGAFFLTRK